MGFRFFKRIKIAPGVTINFSKSGASVSLGPRGAKLTVGGSRGTRLTGGIPGTGLYYTKTLPRKRGARNPQPGPLRPYVPPEHRLTMGFLRRLLTPPDEEALVDGMRAMLAGRTQEAFDHFVKASHLADGAFLAGVTALQLNDMASAVANLKLAAADHQQLGRYFDKYGVTPFISIPVTSEMFVAIEPNLRGVLLTLTEAHQERGEITEAMACLERLVELFPSDVAVKLSLCELLLASPGDADACRRIVELSAGTENESEVHAALLLYKARALARLGMPTAARDVLTATLRRKKNRSAELLLALRYERAQVYEMLGHKGRARSEYEKIYAESPEWEDVAQRLGV